MHRLQPGKLKNAMKFYTLFWKDFGENLLGFVILNIILNFKEYYTDSHPVDFWMQQTFLISSVIIALVLALVRAMIGVKKSTKMRDGSRESQIDKHKGAITHETECGSDKI